MWITFLFLHGEYIDSSLNRLMCVEHSLFLLSFSYLFEFLICCHFIHQFFGFFPHQLLFEFFSLCELWLRLSLTALIILCDNIFICEFSFLSFSDNFKFLSHFRGYFELDIVFWEKKEGNFKFRLLLSTLNGVILKKIFSLSGSMIIFLGNFFVILFGQTPLLHAAYYGFKDCIEKLLEFGANPSLKNVCVH